MIQMVCDVDGDKIEVETNLSRKLVCMDFPNMFGDYGAGRMLTIDQCAALIDALTNAAKEVGR